MQHFIAFDKHSIFFSNETTKQIFFLNQKKKKKIQKKKKYKAKQIYGENTNKMIQIDKIDKAMPCAETK